VPPWIYRRRERALPGAAVPSRDYARETAADCLAAVRASRQRRRSEAAAPAPMPTRERGCDIKGNVNSKGARIYHVPGGEHYAETRIDAARGERWFCSEAEAQAAGWRAAR
jgi:hypothetical protein